MAARAVPSVGSRSNHPVVEEEAQRRVRWAFDDGPDWRMLLNVTKDAPSALSGPLRQREDCQRSDNRTGGLPSQCKIGKSKIGDPAMLTTTKFVRSSRTLKL
jgi:hypothetical protein